MKNLLLGGVAALCIVTTAGIANAQKLDTGYVGASYTDVDNDGDTGSIYAAHAVGSFILAKNFELQVDGDIASVDSGLNGTGSSTVWAPTGHLFYNNGDFKGGAFVGYEDFDGANLTAYGAEARFAVSPKVTIGAVAGGGDIKITGGVRSANVDTYRGEGSYFYSDNLRFDASVAEYKITDADISFTGYSVGGEYQLKNTPVSLTAGYERDTERGDTANAYSVGIRRTFGGTLKDRDRKSSPFNSVSTNYGGAEGELFGALLGLCARDRACD